MVFRKHDLFIVISVHIIVHVLFESFAGKCFDCYFCTDLLFAAVTFFVPSRLERVLTICLSFAAGGLELVRCTFFFVVVVLDVV